jgi:hypothetical protein
MGSSASKHNSKPSLLVLPNELFIEVAAHLESFKDLNSFLRTSRLFHDLLNTLLYRRALTAEGTVREDIVLWVLHQYRVSSLALLLDNGLSIHQELYKLGSMLHRVCYLSHEKRSVPLARLLIERGANLHSTAGSFHGDTPLHAAACESKCKIAELLLAHGADVNAIDAKRKQYFTPLHFAAGGDQRKHFRMVKLLLRAGADVDGLAENGCCTPLGRAYGRGLGRMGTLLLAHGADTNALYRTAAPFQHKQIDEWLKRWAPGRRPYARTMICM